MRFKLIGASLLAIISITGQAQSFQACNQRVAAEPELAPLKDKLSLLSYTEQTFQMKTNSSKPNEDEKKLIVRWLELRDQCWKADSDIRNRFPPEFRSNLESTTRILEELALMLYDGKITYGEFARKRDEEGIKYKAMWDDSVRSLKQQQQQERQQQQQRDAAAAEQSAATNERQRMVQACIFAMLGRPGNFGQNMAASNQCNADPQAHLRPQPPTYRCDRFGNSTTCAPQ